MYGLRTLMAPDLPALFTNTVTSASSIAVLGYTMGVDPLSALGTQAAVMIGTVVALCGGYDLADQFDLFDE
ncbi:hypothetical protein HLRTI_001302 [Halorhabdus tiamatea SARL4B]|uniref:Uncharacterized protein n=3 Tax=Halorhabdus TaxID=146825 RepID=U2E3S9_9EURY|nr:hypothetical protein HLRTI_001302 [Halorhabdus tiamatea SARL4B]